MLKPKAGPFSNACMHIIQCIEDPFSAVCPTESGHSDIKKFGYNKLFSADIQVRYIQSRLYLAQYQWRSQVECVGGLTPLLLTKHSYS